MSSNFDWFVEQIHMAFESLPDSRLSSPALKYEVKDAALGAFSLFFSQSPSFLSYQISMKKMKGKSNAESLFKISEIPTDNQIRNILDPIPPKNLYPIFSNCFNKIMFLKQKVIILNIILDTANSFYHPLC